MYPSSLQILTPAQVEVQQSLPRPKVPEGQIQNPETKHDQQQSLLEISHKPSHSKMDDNKTSVIDSGSARFLYTSKGNEFPDLVSLDTMLEVLSNARGDASCQQEGEILNDVHSKPAAVSESRINLSSPDEMKLASSCLPHQASQRKFQRLSQLAQNAPNCQNGGMILVYYLPDNTTARDIYALFKDCGVITHIILQLRSDTNSTVSSSFPRAYIHFTERHHIYQTCAFFDGFLYKNKVMKVAARPQQKIRDTPGLLYVVPSLELISFSPADGCGLDGMSEACRDQVENPPTQTHKSTELAEPASYSLKPTLTHKTAASSWRRADSLKTSSCSSESVPMLTNSSSNNADADFSPCRGFRSPSLTPSTSSDDDNDDGGVALSPLKTSNDIDEFVDYDSYEDDSGSEDGGVRI